MATSLPLIYAWVSDYNPQIRYLFTVGDQVVTVQSWSADYGWCDGDPDTDYEPHYLHRGSGEALTYVEAYGLVVDHERGDYLEPLEDREVCPWCQNTRVVATSMGALEYRGPCVCTTSSEVTR